MDPATAFILEGEWSRIGSLPPFDQIPKARLLDLLAGCSIVFMPGGSTIVHPEIPAPAPCLWIVREGRVRVTDEVDPVSSPGDADCCLEPGALFPAQSALGRDRNWRMYVADVDTYLWRIEAADMARWLAEPAILRRIALELQDDAVRLRDAVVELVRARHHSDQALAVTVRSVAAADATCVESGRSIADVATLMADRNIDAVLVGSPGAVEGIVTQTDLVVRGLGRGLSPATPVSAVMTAGPKSISAGASLLEAGIAMAQSGFRHLPLRSAEGLAVGLVSERDIFCAQQQGIQHVFRPIDEARSVAELAELARDVREFGERVFRQGMEVSQFTHLLSSLNQRISRRLLRLVGEGRRIDARYCWLAFGSEARDEQGFVTDQDNGIVFEPSPGVDAESVRAELLAFARDVNDGLDACGFARCKGNIMASNPELCLSLGEWKEKFSSWIRATTPKALLNATIFFDMALVHGDEALADGLLDHLFAASMGNTIFLHHMAANALEVPPPIGRISRFNTESGGERRGTIDLKTQGSRLFVDVARIYALAHGVRAANTVERLRIVGQRARRSVNAIEGDIAAFRVIQALRLRRQLDSLRDGGDANRINPYSLDELRQRILRESLRQAVSLQERIKMDYCR